MSHSKSHTKPQKLFVLTMQSIAKKGVFSAKNPYYATSSKVYIKLTIKENLSSFTLHSNNQPNKHLNSIESNQCSQP